jgi:hypothetical protein
MMERIKEIWDQLENNTSPVIGLFKQRYSDTTRCDAYLGIKYPENFRMLIVKTPFGVGQAFHFKYEFRGLKFEKVYDADDSNFLLLNLVLVDRQYRDVFDSLIADVLNNIITEVDLKVILKNYTNRLLKWQSLFEQFNPQGLTPEEQRGLYGELFFIRKFLLANSDFINVINSWVGPEQQIKDFQSGTWCVEVKTTHGNNHQKVHIASERQLDTSNLEYLFLYHISLEARQQSGETLNQLVSAVVEILGSDFASLNRFKHKLLEAGYFDQHTSLYDLTGYFIRDDIFYKVENDFPRIEESDIRDGVGDVKYTIILSHCSPFALLEQEVFQTVLF